MKTARAGVEPLVRIGISLGVLAGLLMTLFVLAPEGQAAFPGVNGKIVFTRKLDANVTGNATTDVYAMNADGTGQVNLTNSPGEDSKPAWSPDGSKIAYLHNTSSENHSPDIYVMNADGTGRINLSNDDAAGHYAPAWSPDGSKIAFVRSGVGIPSSIYVMNADGTGWINLTNGLEWSSHPAWSPDGSKIAFVSSSNSGREVFVMNADGSNVTQLTFSHTNASYPTWSPDGNKIAFGDFSDGKGEIFIMNADGSGLTNKTNHPAHDLYPAWSPNGEKIAFTSDRDGDSEIYVMNANGSTVNLTNNSMHDMEPDWQSLPDTAPPVVSNVQPTGTIYTSTTEVSADYADTGSGIDTGSVTVTIDGHRLVDCVASETQVRCPAEQFATIPEHVGPSGLAYGSHTIGGSVTDQSGNVAPIQGSFFVGDNTPPRVGDVQPSGTIEASSTTVSAGFVDDIADIDTGSVVVTLDGRTLSGCTVTALGWEAWESGWTHQVSCPADNLSPGPHKIGGSVADRAGNISPIKGSFTVVPSNPATQNGAIGIILNWAIGLILGDNGVLGILRSL